MFSVSGKRILVTGASSGIGKATASMLAQYGAEVVLTGRDEKRLHESLQTLTGSGHSAYPFDLSNSEQLTELLNRVISERGSLSGIFHSAGQELVKPLQLLEGKDINKQVALSLTAPLLLAKALTKTPSTEVETKSLVLMSSVAVSVGQRGNSAYAAGKSAMTGFVNSLAVELAPKRIRVNTIVAGGVRTPMHERATSPMNSQSLEMYEKRHLLGFGEAEDIASMALYLLSEQARWITGAEFTVDGGYTCH